MPGPGAAARGRCARGHARLAMLCLAAVHALELQGGRRPDEPRGKEFDTTSRDVIRPTFAVVDAAHDPLPVAGATLLLPMGKAKYIREVSEIHLIDNGGLQDVEAMTYKGTTLYLGLSGTCRVQLAPERLDDIDAAAAGERLLGARPLDERLLRRGLGLAVFGHVEQRLHLGNSTGCRALRLQLENGNYAWPAARGWLESSLDGQPGVPTEQSRLISKQVLFHPRVMPGVYQLALLRLDPGARTDQHQHDTASDMYIGYEGTGCEMQVYGEAGDHAHVAFSLGKVALVGRGTPHKVWNSGNEPCFLANLKFGAPGSD